MVFEAFPSWDPENLVFYEDFRNIPELYLPMKLGDIIRKEVDLVGIPRRQFFTIFDPSTLRFSLISYIFELRFW